jgi:CDP-paratose 2-epimerase
MTRHQRSVRPAGARGNDLPVLITGGAGFIGTNLADRLLEDGRRVVIFDNLSRKGVDRHVRWLLDRHPGRVEVEIGDVRDARLVRRAARTAAAVFHFAAQVAVTTSLVDPCEDFEINARGTLNVLEALRTRPDPPPLVFTSTNKVYGDLEDLALVGETTRYAPADPLVRHRGVGEARPLSFHSPYGCSKGTADQYVLDYARTFKLPCAVFRMSCIYGPHQCGTEDQGWVAHFLIHAIEEKPITIYGDGKQVRDLLFVEDLVRAFLSAERHMAGIAGRAFNIGGGPGQTTSLLELLDHLELLHGERPEVDFDEWRAADQRYYVSDTSAFREATGWAPRVGVLDGLRRLYEWLLARQQVVGLPAVATTTAAS